MEGTLAVNFSHDGLRDSLTHLAAPPYFYENLRRDIATAERNKSRLSLIRFQLFSSVNIDPEKIEIRDELQYEVAILSFAELLKSLIRSEDLCARLGRMEFTLILKAPLEVANSLSSRVLHSWQSSEFECKSSLILVKAGESSLEILNRLDNQELRAATPS